MACVKICLAARCAPGTNESSSSETCSNWKTSSTFKNSGEEQLDANLIRTLSLWCGWMIDDSKWKWNETSQHGAMHQVSSFEARCTFNDAKWFIKIGELVWGCGGVSRYIHRSWEKLSFKFYGIIKMSMKFFFLTWLTVISSSGFGTGGTEKIGSEAPGNTLFTSYFRLFMRKIGWGEWIGGRRIKIDYQVTLVLGGGGRWSLSCQYSVLYAWCENWKVL